MITGIHRLLNQLDEAGEGWVHDARLFSYWLKAHHVNGVRRKGMSEARADFDADFDGTPLG